MKTPYKVTLINWKDALLRGNLKELSIIDAAKEQPAELYWIDKHKDWKKTADALAAEYDRRHTPPPHSTYVQSRSVYNYPNFQKLAHATTYACQNPGKIAIIDAQPEYDKLRAQGFVITHINGNGPAIRYAPAQAKRIRKKKKAERKLTMTDLADVTNGMLRRLDRHGYGYATPSRESIIKKLTVIILLYDAYHGPRTYRFAPEFQRFVKLWAANPGFRKLEFPKFVDFMDNEVSANYSGKLRARTARAKEILALAQKKKAKEIDSRTVDKREIDPRQRGR